MVYAAFAQGRVQALAQIGQGRVRGVQAGVGNFLQGWGKGGKLVGFLQTAYGLQLLLGRVHLLVQVGVVAVHGPVDRAQHLPLHPQVLNVHHGVMSPKSG